MKLSATSWSFPACTLEEASAIVKALGVNALDIGLLHRPALDRDEVLAAPERAAEEVRALGVVPANLYWMFGASPDDRPVSDPSAHAAQRAEFRAVVECAAALGVPTIFVLPGVMRAGATRKEGLEASAAILRELVDMAGAKDIVLTVEPHVHGILDSPVRTLELLDRVPGLKLTLDYAHFVCMGFTQDEVDPLAAHAAHVHIRQARPGSLQAKFHEGTIDFAAVVERLRAVEYDGYVALEAVHQAYMNTLFDDVLTETVLMRDALHDLGVA